MKNYELTILVHPDLEMNATPALDKVKNLVKSHGGTITKEINEGKKRLAYSIKKQDFAIYYYFELTLPSTAPAKISSVLNISDEIIRYLLVTVDNRKIKAAAKRQRRYQNDEQTTTNEDEQSEDKDNKEEE